MKKIIDILDLNELNYTNFSAFGKSVIVVYAKGIASLRIESHAEDSCSFYDYSEEYDYTEQSLRDLEIHLTQINDDSNDISLNGVVDKSTIPSGAFLE
jgi:hypothetical protein